MSLLQIEEPIRGEQTTESEKKFCIGIDFGTTNCVCSVKIDGNVTMITDEFGEVIIPSVVLFKDSDVFVGNQIKKKIKNGLENRIFSIKRDFVENPDAKKNYGNHKQKLSPIEVSSLIFKYLKNCCESFLGKEISKCVVTVPAYFDERSRFAIKQSASLVGFEVLRLVNEPTSAAYAYGLERKTRGNYFVYDLGGGTFDVSILKLTDGVFKVLSTGGDPFLGGDDLDKLFACKIAEDFLNLRFEDLSKNNKVILVRKAKLLKEKLQKETVLNEFLEIDKKKINLEITEKVLNTSISEILDKTISISTAVLEESDLKENEIDGFILVGGSTRLKILISKIQERFQLKIFSDIDPDLVVSKGAALHADGLVNGTENLLLDVTPLSLGIETAGGLMEKIIHRNTTIPIVKEQEFTTYEEGQTAIKIHILQGEREMVKYNRTLGEFVLDGIEPKPPGIPRINVRFMVDANGLLSVSATDKSSAIQKELEVKTTFNLEIDQMRIMIEESIKNSSLDMQERLLEESKVDAIRFINELQSMDSDLKEICSAEELNKINSYIKLLSKEIQKDNREGILDFLKKLDLATQSFSEKRVKQKIKSALIGKNYDKL